MLAAGACYLRHVGPAYGFFGLGLSLYFASQGAGRLLWPLSAGLVRLVIAVGGGWIAFSLTGEIDAVFAALSAALVTLWRDVSAVVASGVWFRPVWSVRLPAHPAVVEEAGVMTGRRYFKDLAVGQKFGLRTADHRHRGDQGLRRAIRPAALHLDEEAARHSPFGGLVRSGWHSAALAMRLWPCQRFSPRRRDPRHRRRTGLVEAGAAGRCVARRNRGHRNAAVALAAAAWGGQGPGDDLNQHGETVQTFAPTLLVEQRTDPPTDQR